jgi:hypothetical protein
MNTTPNPLSPPIAIHCHGRHSNSPGCVYVGRPSKWGNPYRIGCDGDRAEVIRKYRRYLFHQPDLLAALPELTGQQLGCWCKPQPCHADILIRAWHYYVAQAHPLPAPKEIHP